jgi:SWIM zinc finger
MDCNCPDWGVPCKHLAAVCYVLAEAFDDDPFAMLAWRGKTRADLLAALRGKGAGRATGLAPSPGPARALEGDSPALAVLSDVTGRAIEEKLADFWSPGLSQARLRAVPPSPVTPPDLLLRLSDPPPVEVRGQSLRDLLTPVYGRLAGAQDDPPQGEPQSLKASLAFSPACFRSPATWSFCPSAAMSGLSVCSPMASLPSPINFWAAFLALSMKLIPFPPHVAFCRRSRTFRFRA